MRTQSYRIREDATVAEAAGACRAALIAVWDTLEWFEIDLVGLANEPECVDAVAALQRLRRKGLFGRGLESSAHLEPGKDDASLGAALQLIGKTIGSTGLSRENGRMVYDANDGATSCVFDLTPAQHLAAVEALRADGANRDVFIAWDRK